jgi:hypothetical protein
MVLLQTRNLNYLGRKFSMSRLAILLRSRFCFKVVLAACFFLAMTAFETSPLLLRLSTHIPSQPGDPLLVSLRKVTHAATR